MAARDDRLFGILTRLAPGTSLREGLDRIISAGKGAIIVLGYSEAVEPLVSGGFKMATPFSAQRLSELAKMDGAIVLTDETDKVLWANVHLVPDPSIATSETGTRHRTAERTARQTGKPVLSVSESMQVVSLYLDSKKHILEDIASMLVRANQALATLERYHNRLDEVSSSLAALEIENVVTLRDVLSVVQRAEMVRRIAEEVAAYVVQLGTDGRLLRLQLDELMLGVESERMLVIKDYVPQDADLPAVVKALDALEAQDLLELANVAEALGHGELPGGVDEPLAARGHRLLSRIPRLPDYVIAQLVERFGTLQGLMEATLEELDEVDGVGAARARSIKEGVARLAESSMLDRYA